MVAKYLLGNEMDLDDPSKQTPVVFRPSQNLPINDATPQHSALRKLEPTSSRFFGLDPTIFSLPANLPKLQKLAKDLGVEFWNPWEERNIIDPAYTSTNIESSDDELLPPPGIPFHSCFPLHCSPTPPRPRTPMPDPH
jgi:hypothetical protein